MSVWIVQQPLIEPDEEPHIGGSGYVFLHYDDIPDLTHITSPAQARHMLRVLYPGEPPESISRRLEKFWHTHAGMQPEDIVVVPLHATGKLALGRVSGPYEYRTGFDIGDMHMLPVAWLHDSVSMALLRKHRDWFQRPGITEVTDLDARVALRGKLPHAYNRFHKWKWLLAVFMGMGMLHLLMNIGGSQ
jgi:predicted Mrr-cat superfamily restriction endonuclease